MGPAIESNWKSVTVYEDVDVENTILDCKQCHQPGGEGNAKIFRMQELTNPWTHFLRTNTAGGQELLADFQKVHGDEEFGGIPGEQINQSDPAKLERFVRVAGNGDQPNEFPSTVIAVTGRNGTWQNLYENFVSGKAIAPPYHGLKVADDILLESGLRDMGYMVKADMPAEKILIQACSQCHNSSLNQKITRAKFDVELSKMDREEKDLAIERLKLPNDDPKKMPPVRFRSLTESEISQVQDLLRK
ncbi:MAG: hypothetical protein NTX25_09200 [Proteobacteria bacterium]|nr:hypothetical protein [Pseudomonadota bacterium]